MSSLLDMFCSAHENIFFRNLFANIKKLGNLSLKNPDC